MNRRRETLQAGYGKQEKSKIEIIGKKNADKNKGKYKWA